MVDFFRYVAWAFLIAATVINVFAVMAGRPEKAATKAKESDVAKLTREQIIAIEDELAVPYGMVRLMCDGYRVDIHVSQVKPLKYELMVYVNGEWKGSWVKGDCEEAKRFMRPMHRHKYTTEFRTGMRVCCICNILIIVFC